MRSLHFTLEEFASQRRGAQDRLVQRLAGVIGAGINTRRWTDTMKAIERIYREEWAAETDAPLNERALKKFLKNLRKTLEKNTTTKSEAHPTALAVALSILNAVTIAASDADPEVLVLEWITMHDLKVRVTHADVEGQQRPPGEPFDVGGHKMDYPGDTSAPPSLWINCRCVLRPALANPQIASSDATVTYDDAQTQGVAMTTQTDEKVVPEVPDDEAAVTATPWHGVLAPEGVMSGDGRQFAEGALRNRDLPLPLTWQKTSAEGHDQNVTVAKIEKMERIGNEMHASGHFLSIPEADEVVGLIGEFGKFGVSVDADDSAFEFNEESGEVTFTDARICSACIVAIPAFPEAYVALGPHPVLDDEAVEEEFREVDKEERDKRADDGTAMPDGSYPIGNCDDLKNAIQAIGRAKDPAATKRHIKKRKSALGCDEVELPEGWSVSVEEFYADTEMGAAINIVAAAIPPAPSDFFKNPNLTEPTGVVIEANGHTYGHIAQWGVCHIGIGGDCVTAPPSQSNYDYFATGEVITDHGPIRTGSLTVGIPHADGRASLAVAAAHYDDTSAVWANVAVGEDEHGIWFSGMVSPMATEEMIYAARAAGRLSGDWRRLEATGEYEMVGALSINVGGFPKVSIAAGAQVSLVAAGMVEPKEQKSSKEVTAIAQAIVAEMRAAEKRATKMAELKNKFTDEEA